MIVAIVEENNFACFSLEGTYAYRVCGSRSGAGVLGSLVKKGLAQSDANVTGTDLPGDEWVTLTDEGCEAYCRLKMEAV